MSYRNPKYEYEATVFHVVDGDTVDMVVDLGFYIEAKIRFRLKGIDTPERGQEGFAEAAEALTGYMSAIPLHVVSEKTGKYGRWLGTIFDKDGNNINQLMLDNGFGVPYV